MAKAAGWYPDPIDDDALKYWDGESWASGLFDDAPGVTRGQPLDAKDFLDEIDPPARVPLRSGDSSGRPDTDSQTAGMLTQDLFEEDRSVAVADRSRPPVPESDTGEALPARAATTAAMFPPVESSPEPETAPNGDAPPGEAPNGEGPDTDSLDTPQRRWGVIFGSAAAITVALALLGVAVWLGLASSSEVSDSETAEDVEDAPSETAAAVSDAESTPSDSEESDAADEAPTASAEDQDTTSDSTGDAPASSPLITTREVTVLVDGAPVHEDPGTASAQVGALVASDSPSVSVVGQPAAGWYFVLDSDGWVFGANIVPQAEGLAVARTLDGEAAILLDETGAPTGVESQTGSHVLVIDQSEPLWLVILPEYGFAYVDSATVELVEA